MFRSRPISRAADQLLPLFAAAVLCAAPISHAEPAPYRWHNVAIGGGGFVTGVTFHPAERGLAYARTDVGGAYRWDARAWRWIALTDWLGYDDDNLLGIESLAVDPNDPERVYLAAGTYTHARAGNGAILRSHDRGRTFQRADLPFKLGGNELGRGNGERLAVDPNDGRVLFLGTRTAGLWRSADHGAHWTRVESFPAIATSAAASASNAWRTQPVGIVFVVFDPDSGRAGAPTPTLYAGVSTRDTSLYRSTDGGAHWAPVPNQPRGLRPNHMVRAADGSFYLSYGDEPGPDTMHDGAAWKYMPADGRWTDITPVPQSTDTQGDGFGWGAIAVDPNDPRALLASTFCRYGPHDDIFRSTDGGVHWTPVFPHAEFDHSTAAWTHDHRPHWIADLAIDPFDSGHAKFVTGYGLWATHDLTALDRGGRVHWRFDNTGLEETVALGLISPPTGAPLISALGDLDGFRHDDLDVPPLQFAGPRLTNGESIDFAGRAPEVIVRSGRIRERPADDTRVRAAYSRDGARTWSAFASEPPEGDGAGRIALAADGRRVLWRPEEAGAWWSDDFGRRWQRVQGLPPSALFAADRVDAKRFYGFDPASGRLFVSTDRGATFAPDDVRLDPIGVHARLELRPAPDASAAVYLVADGQGLLRWTAGELQRLPGIDAAYSLGFGKAMPGHATPALYLSGRRHGQPGLFRSDDGGRNWRRIDDDAHRFGRIWHVTGDPRVAGRVYFAASGRGIVYGDPR